MAKRAAWLWCLAVLTAASISRVARAGPDEHADYLRQHAMTDLFAGARFDEAKAALQQVIAGCARCLPETLAAAHRDLGVVYITAFSDPKHGAAEMKKARSLDPNLLLDPAMTTPDVQAVFDQAAPKGRGPVEQHVDLDEDSSLEEEKEAPARTAPSEKVEPAPEPACMMDPDCAHDEACHDGKCVARPSPPRSAAVWLSLGLMQDAAFLNGTDACTERGQLNNGFTCLRASGSQYHGTPVSGSGGNASGVAFASTRVSFASDLPFSNKFSAGLRLAYTFAGKGPEPDGGKAFLPFEAELKAAYWFSERAFSTENLGSFVELSSGVAETGGSKKVTVQEDLRVAPPANQLDNPPSQTLNAYHEAGSGFVAAGAGVFLPFGRAAALNADLRLLVLFPTAGTALSLGLSGALGMF